MSAPLGAAAGDHATFPTPGIGMIVELHGLTSKPALNGRQGCVVSSLGSETGRVGVRLGSSNAGQQRGSEVLAVRPSNLLVVKTEPEPESIRLAFKIMLVAGKGFGVVAARDISRGERLMAEQPLAHVTAVDCIDQESASKEFLLRINSAASGLSTSDHGKFFSLTQHTEHYGIQKTVEGVWCTNALPMDNGEQGIFLQA